MSHTGINFLEGKGLRHSLGGPHPKAVLDGDLVGELHHLVSSHHTPDHGAVLVRAMAELDQLLFRGGLNVQSHGRCKGWMGVSDDVDETRTIDMDRYPDHPFAVSEKEQQRVFFHASCNDRCQTTHRFICYSRAMNPSGSTWPKTGQLIPWGHTAFTI